MAGGALTRGTAAVAKIEIDCKITATSRSDNARPEKVQAMSVSRRGFLGILAAIGALFVVNLKLKGFFMSKPIVIDGELSHTRGSVTQFKWAPIECHTGLFVQNSFAGHKPPEDPEADFLLALNGLRLSYNTKLGGEDENGNRLRNDATQILGPVQKNRDTNWPAGTQSWASKNARDNIGCFVQRDPLTPSCLWGGMQLNCGDSDDTRRFWVAATPEGRRLFFHHNLMLLFAQQSGPYTLTVTVTESPKPPVVPDSILFSFDIELPEVPSNTSHVGYFLGDMHPTGRSLLLCGYNYCRTLGQSGTGVRDAGRPVRRMHNIVEVRFTVTEQPIEYDGEPPEILGVTYEVEELRTVVGNKTIADGGMYQYTYSESGVPSSELDAQGLIGCLIPTGRHTTPSVFIGDPDACTDFQIPSAELTWFTVQQEQGPALGVVEVFGASDELYYSHEERGVIGAFYGQVSTDPTAVEVKELILEVTESYSRPYIAPKTDDIIATGSMSGEYLGCDEAEGAPQWITGQFHFEVPPRTSGHSKTAAMTIYMGDQAVISYSGNEAATITQGAVSIDYVASTEEFGVNTATTYGPVTTTISMSFSSSNADLFPAPPGVSHSESFQYEPDTGTASPMRPGYAAEHSMYLWWDGISTGWMSTDALLNAAPGKRSGTEYSFDSFGWTFGWDGTDHAIQFFIDMHGGCNNISVWATHYSITDPNANQTVYRSAVVSWDHQMPSPEFVGESAVHEWGPPIGSPPSVSRTPLYAGYNCASFNPVTKQLAYGFHSPVCWQGSWEPYGSLESLKLGCEAEVPAMYITSRNKPFGVVKLTEDVYIPQAIAGWAGTPVPAEAAPDWCVPAPLPEE